MMAFRIQPDTFDRYGGAGYKPVKTDAEQKQQFQQAVRDAVGDRKRAGGSGHFEHWNEQVGLFEQGDTPERIAARFNLDPKEFESANRGIFGKSDPPKPGEAIFLPPMDPKRVADDPRNKQGIPEGEGAFREEIRNRAAEWQHHNGDKRPEDSRKLRDELARDVTEYLNALDPSERAAAAKRLLGDDKAFWGDAPAAREAVTIANQAQKILKQAEAANGPETRFQVLRDGHRKASAQVRAALLDSKAAQKIIDEAAQRAADAVWSREGFAGDQLMARLDLLTGDADKLLAARVVAAALAKVEAVGRNGSTWLNISGQGDFSLQKIVDRIAGTEEGDSAIWQMAGLDFRRANLGTLESLMRTGANPAYLIALLGHGKQVSVANLTTLIDDFRGAVGRAVDAANLHRQELVWRLANYGRAMTPAQLQKAVERFRNDNPEWTQKQAELDKAAQEAGRKLLAQLVALRNPSRGGSPSQRPLIDRAVERILDDPSAMQAMSSAVSADPVLIDSPPVQTAIGSMVQFGDKGRGFTQSMATLWLKRELSKTFDDLSAVRRADFNQVLAAAISRFRVTGARLLGTSPEDVGKAVTLLQQFLRGPNESGVDWRKRLSTLDAELEKLTGRDGINAFGRPTELGQLFRGLALIASAVSLWQALSKESNEAAFLDHLKTAAAAAGVFQKSIEFLNAIGTLSDDRKVVHQLGSGSKPAVKGLGVFGAILDLVTAGAAFERGDAVSGTLSLFASAGGIAATLGTGSIAGPIGTAVVTIALIGQVAWGRYSKVQDSNRFMNDTSVAFLRFAGLSEDTARALTDQSGEGFSPVPFLVRYAQLKGYDLSKPGHQKPFADWINGMPVDKLAKLRDNIHLVLDQWGGDVDKFELSNITDPIILERVNAREFIGRDSMSGEPIYGSPLRSQVEAGLPAPMQTAVQFEATLGMLGLETLAPPPG
jgi:hypothetical protein